MHLTCRYFRAKLEDRINKWRGPEHQKPRLELFEDTLNYTYEFQVATQQNKSDCGIHTMFNILLLVATKFACVRNPNFNLAQYQLFPDDFRRQLRVELWNTAFDAHVYHEDAQRQESFRLYRIRNGHLEVEDTSAGTPRESNEVVEVQHPAVAPAGVVEKGEEKSTGDSGENPTPKGAGEEETVK